MQYIIIGEDSFYTWINKIAIRPGCLEDRLWELISRFMEDEKEYFRLEADETETGEPEIFCFTVEEDGDDVLVFDFSADGECKEGEIEQRNRLEFSYN